MESSLSEKCAICQESHSKNNIQISFNCGHSFCLKCFPYILYNILNTQGLNKAFFDDINAEYPCLICQKGTAPIPFTKFVKFETSLESKLPKTCNCQNQENMDMFCLSCKNVLCKLCLKESHNGHEIVALSEIYKKAENLKSDNVKTHLSEINEHFSEFKTKFNEYIKNSFENENKQFCSTIDNIIEKLIKLKEKSLEKKASECLMFNKQLSLIHWALSFLKEEMNQKEYLYPNKLFHLSNFFALNEKKTLTFEQFEIKFDLDLQLKYLTEIANKFSQDYVLQPLSTMKEIGLIKVSNQLDPSALLKTLNFSTEISEIFNKTPSFLNQMGFSCFRNKSHVSCSFVLGDETFVVWPCSTNDHYYNPLSFYNASTNHTDKVIEHKTAISVLSTYPNETSIQCKQWLYCGDANGILRIYQIEKTKNFKLIYEIEAFKSKPILSVVIFDDKYDQISDKNEQFEKVYALISSYDNTCPIKVCKIANGKADFILEIQNPMNQPCSSINFYYDEILHKTCLFLGFQNVGVSMYDLTNRNYVKNFPCKGGQITSINFILNFEDQQKIERLMIYTAKNIVTIANIDLGKVIKEAALSDVTTVYDLCIWDKKKRSLVVAANNQDSLKLLNFEDLSVTKTVSNEKACPINIIKSVRKEGNQLKECVFIVNSCGNCPLITFE